MELAKYTDDIAEAGSLFAVGNTYLTLDRIVDLGEMFRPCRESNRCWGRDSFDYIRL